MKKYKRVTPFVTLLALIVLLFMIIFFQNFVYLINDKYYEKVNAEILKNETDGLFDLLPMIRIKYEYDGDTYKSDVFVVTKILFNYKEKSHHYVYVNKKAPEYVLYMYNPKNTKTVIKFIAVVGLVCVFYIIVNTFINAIYYIMNFRNRKMQKRKDKEIRKIRKRKKKLLKEYKKLNNN